MKKLARVLAFSLLVFTGINTAMAQQSLAWDPGTAPTGSVLFSTNSAAGQYTFRVTTTNTAQSVGYWRTALRVTSGEADLYLRRGDLPTLSTNDVKSENSGTDVVTQSLTAGQDWYILVNVTTNGQWSLCAGDMYVQSLSWDSGLTEIGTGVSETNSTGEDRYFRIVTENADLGMWRTVLKTTFGDAGLYIKSNALAVVSSGISVFDHQSNQTGDDGLVLPLSNTIGAGQVWYVLVKPQAGSSWNLFSGDIFVHDLGALAADGSSGSGLSTIPAEGVKFFKTTIPAGTLAWRLWLQDSTGTNTLNQSILVRKGLAPNSLQYDRLSNGQMLVVPSLLEAGSTSPYYVSVSGARGSVFQLDSRKHSAEILSYGNSTNETVQGFLFKTYRVDVPPDQIAWELLLEPKNNTNPDMAVHYARVPNATDNMAFSELASTNKSESVTLVPPQLSSGSYYITLYSSNTFSFALSNRQPIITQTDYISDQINDDVNRAGWRYYAVTDIDQQLGYLGWDLILADQVNGSLIAIRRNNIPGQWSYRENGSLAIKSRSYSDKSNAYGRLQDPDHAADVWYVGVYTPTAALGSFRLSLNSVVPIELNMEYDSVSDKSLNPGNWYFYQVDVSAISTNGQPILGWELRIPSWIGVAPNLIVRRGNLPKEAKTSGFTPQSSTNWVSGSTWAASGGEWTGYTLDSTQTITNQQTILSMAMGRPLEPGRYYIGVYNPSADQQARFSLESKAIGNGMAYDIGVLPVDGEVAITDLPSSGVAYYRLDLPGLTNRNWKFKLRADSGESMLYIRRGYVPTWGQDGEGFYSPGDRNAEEIGQVTRLQKTGDEYFVLFPENTLDEEPAGELYDPFIPGGTYYCMVVSEGQSPTDEAIGFGVSSATLQSLGEIEPDYLGVLNEEPLTFSGFFADGEIDYLNFSWGGGAGWYQVDVNSTNDSADFNSLYSVVVANDKGGPSRYGGMYSGYSEYDIPEFMPYTGYINIVVSDPRSKSLTTGADYDITVSRYPSTDIAFDGARMTVTGLCGSVVYKVVVPESFEGWELRLTEWAGSKPSMTVCRDDFPDPNRLGSTIDITPTTATNWLSYAQWAVSSGDWTKLPYDPTGTNQHPQYVMSMAKDRPLVPGTYYIAFDNPSCSNPSSFSFETRAIGSGYHYQPTSLQFKDGMGIVSNLAAREVQYFTVDVPEGAASWAVKLENTVGESSLYIRKGFVPTTGQKTAGFYSPAKAVGDVTHLQKNGDEYFVFMPESTNNLIPAGTYYLMVVSQGQNPTSTRIGVGTSSAVLRSMGEAAVMNLGALPQTGEIVFSNQYAAGASVLCQFTVPEGVRGMELRMQESTGYSMLHVDQGAWFPPVNSTVSTRYAGFYSGNSSASQKSSAEVVTVSQPTNGVWSVLITDPRASEYLEAADFTLSLTTLSTQPMDFFDGNETVTNLPPNNWTFFNVEVPSPEENGGDFLGWELRMKDWTGQNPPHLVVRRNVLPDGIKTQTDTGSSWKPANALLWPSKYQWATTTTPYDWTFYRYTSGKTKSYPEYILSMAKDRPLEPGSYLVGIYNPSLTTNCSVSLVSRVIGGSTPDYPVTDLAFNGGEATVSDLPVRGLAYYKVTIPEGMPSWNVQLDNVSGESMLYIRKDYVPTWEQTTSSIFAPDESTDKMVRLKKTGDEHYTLTPKSGESSIPSGDYYLMVVSEGVNPTATDAGSGASSAVLKSLGPDGVLNLGTLNIGSNLTANIQYAAGDVRLVRFFSEISAPAAFELRLTDRVGTPNMSLLSGFASPNNDGDISSYYGGMYSPTNATYTNQQIITVANAPATAWSLVVSDPSTAANLQNGSCTLTIKAHELCPMNGDAGFNTNGMVNTASGTLVDQQRAYYAVTVPETMNGEPVLGWNLTSSMTQGSLDIRVRNGALPEDGNKDQTGWGTNALMVVPPFLTNGTWYVEVKGTGSTVYSLTSSFLTGAKRVWNMPATGENITTPGLAAPLFGDTGVDTNGVPLTGDQGIDLVRGQYDVYAVMVPLNNTGLLATRLEAISGNPDLYIRSNNIPTLNHDMDDKGYFYERSLKSAAFTEYGNWVPLTGRTETELASGIWYIMVKAEGASDARYRLKLSCGNAYAGGNVQVLSLDAGTAAYTSQTLAKGDWRYYRVEMPDPVPFEWVLHSAATQGDVDLYVRDTVPPGHGIATNSIIDWRIDDKMAGTETNYINEGANAIGYSLLKAGKTYYVGVMAKVDSTFSIGSTTNGGVVPVSVPLDFYTGFVSNQIPPRSSITYQIAVPVDAVRWMHSNSNSSSVQLYLKQGGWPTVTVNDYKRTSGSGSMNQFLFGQPWPWLTGEPYFLTVTNTSASTQSFVLDMNGSNAIEFPAGVTASDGTYPDRIIVSWSSVSGVSKYDVYRSTQTNPALATLVAGSIYSTAWNDLSPVRGVPNYYWVAVNGAPDSSWFSPVESGWLSGVADVSPLQFSLPYSATNVSVTVTAASNLLWSVNESLSWVAVSPAQSNGNGSVQLTLSAHNGATTRTGTVYVAGNLVTILQDGFGVPQNVQASKGTYSDRIVVTWDLMPADAYRYYIRRAIVDDFGQSVVLDGYAGTNQYIDGSVEPDRDYYYWVRAQLISGYGDWSASDRGWLLTSGMTSWINLHFPGGYAGDDADSDGDGFSNIEEYIAGTVPTNGASLFSPGFLGIVGGYAVFEVPESMVNRIYDVEWTESLAAPWTASQLNEAGFGGELQLQAPMGGSNKRFFRPTVRME